MVQEKINRGRHTERPAGRHSIRTNQCPPPPSPHYRKLRKKELKNSKCSAVAEMDDRLTTVDNSVRALRKVEALTSTRDKSSAVAEMGDRARAKWTKKWVGCCSPVRGRSWVHKSRKWGMLGPHLTQCGLGRGLPPYHLASWSIQPFGHSTPTLQTGHRQDNGTDSIGRTVLHLPCDCCIMERCCLFSVPWMALTTEWHLVEWMPVPCNVRSKCSDTVLWLVFPTSLSLFTSFDYWTVCQYDEISTRG